MNIVHQLLSGGDPDFEDIYVEVPWIEILTRHDFPTFCREVIDPMGLSAALFGFLQAWWPLRNQPNVLLLHFADMKRDHEGSLRQIADFIGARPTNQEWSAITEYTSFSWMNQHRIKFDLFHRLLVCLAALVLSDSLDDLSVGEWRQCLCNLGLFLQEN